MIIIRPLHKQATTFTIFRAVNFIIVTMFHVYDSGIAQWITEIQKNYALNCNLVNIKRMGKGV
jgi:hypothetical protein